MLQHNVFTLISLYNENKDLINAYYSGESIENFKGEGGLIAGMGVATFITVLSVSLALWIWALVAIIKFWNYMPTWARVVSLLALLAGIGGPVVSLIVVYASKTSYQQI